MPIDIPFRAVIYFSICERRDRTRQGKDAILDRRKQRAVDHLVRRSCCAVECEKCGLPVTGACAGECGGKKRDHRIPYQFCDDCREEFIDYIERLKGRGDPDCYWRNEAWLEVWSTWINHRAALDRHARSKEFARLLQEIKDITSE